MLPTPPHTLRRAVGLASMLSGAAALLYQGGDVRLLTLSVGATWTAITVVLSGFMAGLGLGAWGGGRLADRLATARLGRAYAAVEGAIALGGLAVLALAPALGAVPAELPGWVRPVLGALLVGAPAMAMGATGPLLAVLLARAGAAGRQGAHVAGLYALNAGGGALGALAGGLWLPYAVGVPAMLGVAVALNGAAAALLLRCRLADAAEPEPEATGGVETAPARAVAALAFGSGLVALLGETTWTRSLAQIDAGLYMGRWLQPTDVLSVVLGAVLVGQAVGGAWAARAAARRSVGALLTRLGVVLGLGGLASLPLLEAVSVAVSGTAHPAGAPGWGMPLRLALVLPAGLALGATFPLLGAIVARGSAAFGRRLGGIWALNTVGTVLGSLLGGALVLPTIGSGGGLLAAAGLAVALGALAVGVGGGPRRLLGLHVLAATALVAVGLAVPLRPGAAYRAAWGPDAVLDAWEGWEATTVVVQPPHNPRALVTNGRAIMGNVAYAARAANLQKLVPDAQRALLVGFGTGNFARSLLRRRWLTHLDIVEIDAWQARAAPLFQNDAVLTDPQVHLTIDDGMHLLGTTTRTWDLIALDAWGPEACPLLYTTDLHARAMAHLSERGVFWAKLSQLQPDAERALLDAARCTWPYAWLTPAPDVGLAGSRSPPTLPPGSVALPPADARCRPHTHLHPVRVRLAEHAR